MSFTEAEKTDEQRYSEEQDAIDRQTKKKLQERADAEKMEHLPSEGNTEHKQHEVKIVASYYEDVVSGKKSFELRKNDRGYKQGDSLKMLEFKDGKHTGRTINADIIYMLEDYTGLTEGYCILGIRVTDYTGKVSETDTESGAVNVWVYGRRSRCAGRIGTGSSRQGGILPDMRSQTGVDNNSASMGAAVCDMEKGA